MVKFMAKVWKMGQEGDLVRPQNHLAAAAAEVVRGGPGAGHLVGRLVPHLPAGGVHDVARSFTVEIHHQSLDARS
jgi:hypothetical protein